MTYTEFVNEYSKHDGEKPYKAQLRWDGYELRFDNGDVYRHEETLKPGAQPSSWSQTYFSDQFIYTNTWNGKEIDGTKIA